MRMGLFYTFKGSILFLLALLCLPVSSTFASDFHCQYIKPYQNYGAILPANKMPQRYLIQNVTRHRIWLDQQNVDTGANAGWRSELDPKRWSALQVSEKNFALICLTASNRHFEQINCARAIHICKVNVPSSKKGSYWVSENLNWREMVQSMETDSHL